MKICADTVLPGFGTVCELISMEVLSAEAQSHQGKDRPRERHRLKLESSMKVLK